MTSTKIVLEFCLGSPPSTTRLMCKTGNIGFKPRITQESIKTLISTVVLLLRERFKLENKYIYIYEYYIQCIL